ncbi:hypothetical protein IFM89_008745 [Coptis chinensis]|uniref:Endopeptidase Clp n=1 Tax=Coptis chinensis TaxID=261450 RepID=A0A835HK26_9MAGN|nr:hypothetical protein IFM89_008745 [Coptis chinensis]
MGIYDAMKMCKADVSTVSLGLAASMGAFLLASGSKGKRFCMLNARVMIHQPLGTSGGKGFMVWITGGIKVKADGNESLTYVAMLATQVVATRWKELGITTLHIKLRAIGGNNTKTLGPSAQSALRALARFGLKIGRIEDVTPIPNDGHACSGLSNKLVLRASNGM